MAMFEQMRANVGKLLKGIDRSEPGRRERFCSGGMEERVFWESRGWSGLRLPWRGISCHLGDVSGDSPVKA